MSRSLFSQSPFRPFYGARLHGLGQDAIKDIFGDTGEAVVKLVGELDQYIEKLPVGVAGPYTARRDDCMRKSAFEQYKCLYDLFQDIKKALKDEEDRAATPTVTTTAKPVSKGLPIVPIVIGGVAAAAILYAIFKA